MHPTRIRAEIQRDERRARQLEAELARLRADIERSWARLLDAELKT